MELLASKSKQFTTESKFAIHSKDVLLFCQQHFANNSRHIKLHIFVHCINYKTESAHRLNQSVNSMNFGIYIKHTFAQTNI